MERCILCGGKLVNGKCTECGLDNTKNDRKYKLNTHNESEVRFHSGECAENLNQNCDSSAAWGAWQDDKSAAGGQEDSGKSGKRQGAGTRAQREKVLRQRRAAGTVRKKSSLNKVILLIVVLVALAEMFGSVLTGFLSGLGSSDDGLGAVAEKLLTINEGDGGWETPAGEKPEKLIWNESSDGYFEKGLTMGIYTVGYDIPAGSYQMFCDEGTAWCYLVDAEGDGSESLVLYSVERQESYAESFGECDYYELSGELTLENGDLVYVEECDEGVFIRGEGDGEDSLQQHAAQKLPGTVTAKYQMTAGEDFEPGVYDVTLEEVPEDEYASAYLMVTTSDGDIYSISLHQQMSVFYRFPFREGDEVELTTYGDAAEVTLTPSY